MGVCLERGPELVAALLAVLKAGAAYVPLDPAYPAGRLEGMLRDADAHLLVTQEALRGVVSAPGAAVVSVDGADRDAIAAAREDDPRAAVSPRNLAYLIYTSGSTGTPRGVAIEHASAVAMLAWGASIWPAAELAGSLASTSICFDVSVAELFLPLATGGCVVLARDVLELPRLSAADRVRTVSTVPSAIAVLLESGGIPAGVTTVALGGETLRRELADALYAHGVERVIDLYGPSEDTTYSTWALRAPGGPETIGRPIAHTRAYVLDASQRLAPPGVTGELYLGGRGLARGYLGRPALTAARFVPDPFATGPGARMYRTGDRVRRHAGGTLEYRGRLDHQVKVRGGFRVEPGEVEAALRRAAGVRDCVVVARDDASGGTVLVAYLVGDVAVDEARAALRRTLPDYMVPSAFVALDALPLTPNGKVDRGALPDPPSVAGDDFQPPRTATEAALAEIWAQLLGMDRVGVTDDFFALGGHSLLGVLVMSRVLEELGVKLSLRDLFNHPNVAALAARVDERRRLEAEGPEVAPADDGGSLRLSFAQERLWFLQRLQPESVFYNVAWALRLRGALDVAALERALAEVVRRHAALRTAFPEIDGVPVPVVEPFAGLSLDVEEIAGEDEDARDAVLRRRLAAEAQRPFDLATGPLLRARLLRMGAGDHVLLLCIHHIVVDGWSLRVLHAELAEAYGAFRDGRDPSLPTLPLQYADYAGEQRHRLRGPVLERELDFWRERLAGAPALLDLPLDHPRPARQSFRGATERISLPLALLQRLRDVGRGERAPAYMVLLAAFELLLARYTGTTDLVVGTLVAGRSRKELEGLVGFLVNTVALRSDLSGDPGFLEALRRVRASTLDAFEHQEIPFEKVVEALQPKRGLGHSPLFQVAFRLSSGGLDAPMAGVETETLEIDLPVTRFDLTAFFTVAPGRFEMALEYATDLFERATIVRMAGHLRRVLEQVAADPDLPLSRLELLDEAERRRVIEEWNPPAAPSSDACVHHLFEAQAARTPGAFAIHFHGGRVSYAELDAAANRLAHHLRARGVRAESCVGVCLERAPELVVALLAVLKAGGAYVPLDPAYPRERLGWTMGDARVRVVLTSTALAGHLPEGAEPVCVDALADALASLSGETPGGGAEPGNLSHVIFTSGSTGRPKGVMIRHASTVARLRWLRDAMDDDERAAVLGSTSINFDVSIAEIFGTLCRGGTLVLVEYVVSSVGP
ncbi:MAG TPA: amino acid adenylation domain-containing protein [Longimicrobium sp.]|nr:amino acid adenylation domain-containing protein [Longimicrobium sp.]